MSGVNVRFLFQGEAVHEAWMPAVPSPKSVVFTDKAEFYIADHAERWDLRGRQVQAVVFVNSIRWLDDVVRSNG